MKLQYNVETSPFGQEIIWYEKNGIRVSFTADPSNSDYQEYLKSLEEIK